MTHVPETLTECTCSICRRLGAQWAYYNPGEVEIASGEELLVGYAWQSRKLTFHHCRVCGCTTHYSVPDGDGRRVRAVNARMLPADETAQARIRLFDGAESWKYLDE